MASPTTQEQKDIAHKLFEQGLCFTEISKKIGRSRSTTARILGKEKKRKSPRKKTLNKCSYDEVYHHFNAKPHIDLINKIFQ